MLFFRCLFICSKKTFTFNCIVVQTFYPFICDVGSLKSKTFFFFCSVIEWKLAEQPQKTKTQKEPLEKNVIFCTWQENDQGQETCRLFSGRDKECSRKKQFFTQPAESCVRWECHFTAPEGMGVHLCPDGFSEGRAISTSCGYTYLQIT